MNNKYFTPGAICFVQNYRGEFRHRNYPYYVTEGKDEDGFHVDTIRDETGKPLFSNWRMDTRDELKRLCGIEEDRELAMIPHLQRYGRDHDDAVKIGVGHLTDGTVIETAGLLTTDLGIVTVKEVFTNGPGSWCVRCHEMRPGISFSDGATPTMEPVSFHISFIKKILNRPLNTTPAFVPDKPKFSFSDFEKTGRFIDFQTFVNVISGYMGRGTEMSHRYVDQAKLFKRLSAMGLAKVVRRPQSPWAVRYHPGAAMVDYKRATAFIMKNPHWAFHTEKESVRQDSEFWEEAHRDFDDAFWETGPVAPSVEES